jgi:tetrahydromethanopterin S-methyltransferase subunit F
MLSSLERLRDRLSQNSQPKNDRVGTYRGLINMYSNELFQQLAAARVDLAQINISETQPNEVRVEENQPTDTLFYGIATGLLFSGAILFLMLLKTLRLKQAKKVEPLKYSSQVPCRNCRYFSNNPYVRCAVHPSTVLTAKAIDCPDRSPLDDNFPH